MSIGATRQKLDERIAELEAKLARLRNLRDAIDDEDIAREFSGLFSQNSNGSTVRKPNGSTTQRVGKSKNFAAIVDAFNGTNNEWATMEEVCTNSGLKNSAVRQIVYKSHGPHFDRRPHPDGGSRKQFRLKNQVSSGGKDDS